LKLNSGEWNDESEMLIGETGALIHRP